MTQRELPNFTQTSINACFVVACLDFGTVQRSASKNRQIERPLRQRSI